MGRNAFRTEAGDDESGVALVMVVGSMLVLAMLALAALAYTMSSQKFARYDQDYAGAIAAAQSGAEDYISRLNRSDVYGATVDCANTALQGPMNVCGWNSTTAPGWLPVVAGTTDPDAAWFHYSADVSNAAVTGTILLTVTGRVNNVYRTIETAVGKGSSTDYVYYTDFESADPLNVQAYGPTNPAGAKCGGTANPTPKYWYDGREGAGCTEITFITGDELDGAVFTNDAIFSGGGSFLKTVQSVNPGCGTVTGVQNTWKNCLRSGSTANFNNKQPQLAKPKYLYDTSVAFATHPGCHYYGATRIIFNANGTMTVWNKRVNNGDVGPVAIAPPGGAAPLCGTLDQLDDPAGASLVVPNEMVIYTGMSTVPQKQCLAGQIGGTNAADIGELPLGNLAASTPFPPTASNQTYKADLNMAETTKACARGNLYVEGVLKGRATLAAAESVIVTGDLVLAGGRTGGDMLGLVATNSVEVFHPRVATYKSAQVNWNCNYGCTYKWNEDSQAEAPTWPHRYIDPTTGAKVPADGIQVAGSIQTLLHSFLVQKYDVGGDQGKLFVWGSIAQRWRGIVGKGSDGYKKDYKYDTRLQYSAPPYFPKWANSQWSLRYSGEVNTSSVVRSSAP